MLAFSLNNAFLDWAPNPSPPNLFKAFVPSSAWSPTHSGRAWPRGALHRRPRLRRHEELKRLDTKTPRAATKALTWCFDTFARGGSSTNVVRRQHHDDKNKLGVSGHTRTVREGWAGEEMEHRLELTSGRDACQRMMTPKPIRGSRKCTTSPRSLAPGTRSGSVGPARGHPDPPVGTCPLHLSMATYDCQQQLFPMSPQLFCWSVAPRPIALAWQTRQSKRRNHFCKGHSKQPHRTLHGRRRKVEDTLY